MELNKAKEYLSRQKNCPISKAFRFKFILNLSTKVSKVDMVTSKNIGMPVHPPFYSLNGINPNPLT